MIPPVLDPTDYAARQSQQSEARRTELGQDAFLRLMSEQLKNQDPLKPLDSNQFLGQLAQFSTVKGIEGLQQTISSLATSLSSDQALQGAGLIGRTALIPADRATLAGDGNGINGAVYVDAPGTVSIEITDATGQMVRRIERSATAPGDVDFQWDGKDAGGQAVPAGEYQFKASYRGSDGKSVGAIPMLEGRVDSVVLSASGLVLNLAGMGPVALTAVRRIS